MSKKQSLNHNHQRDFVQHRIDYHIDYHLKDLVFVAQLLVKSEADLFAENEEHQTPCDCAEKQHHKELALSLESQMVFSQDPGAQEIEAEYAALDRREVCSALHNFLFLFLRNWSRSMREILVKVTLCHM